MIGTTLRDIREHIETLASEDGRYYVVCGRTGERPVPAAGLRFESRPTARVAVRATEQYRTALRRYDPRAPQYELIVCEETAHGVPADGGGEHDTASDEWMLSDPVLDEAQLRPERQHRVEFCHRVAAAIFETLSESAYDGVKTAIMDAYFSLAETVEDPDEQAALLADAASQHGPVSPVEDPVQAALTVLRRRGLIGDFTSERPPADTADGIQSLLVSLSDYALSPRDGRLPILPVVIERYRYQPAWEPAAIRVTDAEDGWRLTIESDRGAAPTGFATVPIRTGE